MENVAKMKYAMEKLPGFDVPFIAEVKYGPNWHNMEKYDESNAHAMELQLP